jgi:hypothetical protein
MPWLGRACGGREFLQGLDFRKYLIKVRHSYGNFNLYIMMILNQKFYFDRIIAKRLGGIAVIKVGARRSRK